MPPSGQVLRLLRRWAEGSLLRGRCWAAAWASSSETVVGCVEVTGSKPDIQQVLAGEAGPQSQFLVVSRFQRSEVVAHGVHEIAFRSRKDVASEDECADPLQLGGRGKRDALQSIAALFQVLNLLVEQGALSLKLDQKTLERIGEDGCFL